MVGRKGHWLFGECTKDNCGGFEAGVVLWGDDF